ncbi:nucleotidyltransferase family protein [Vibrio bivalvicida]|uniref:Alcohol dehydrogenase n=1 Tax=Vibrio bivalvicida TaxID=1276888 RepID=A0A177Y5L6_9VIBR|nr:nucleotidyltransferase family protein [Vibrio bivalvicida]OAJ96163.1 alcohol dehydrogenase [Vibrio bivalvicida]
MIDNWKRSLVQETSTIRDVLEILDVEGLRVALVIDDDKILKGVVTDGDIRRGLLEGESLETPINRVMNDNPYTAQAGTSREELIAKMNELDFLFIPILQGSRLVGLETLHGALVHSERKRQNPIFIMAGGFGTRLRPLTDNCPKPMLKIGDKPILETLINSFKKAGFVNFYISTHYMPEVIVEHFEYGHKFGVNITYVHEDTPLGTGGALGLLQSELPNNLPVIMINGDVLTKVDFERLLDFHISNDADATMCVREYDYQIPYGVVEGDGSQVTAMVEKPIQRFFVNAGIYVISSDIVKSVEKGCSIDMPTLLERHIDESKNVLMFPIHEYWLDIGRMDDFNRAQMEIHTLGVLD